MKLKKSLIGGLALAMLQFATVANADTPMITGKSNVVCASQDIMACVDDGVCLQGKPSTFDLPTFMFVDVKTRAIRAVDGEGLTVESPIKTHEVTEQSAIMQGYENHRGWTLAIDKTDGSFTLSATGPDVNFMIMGACTQL